MDFGQVVTNPDAWKGSGVVTGVHTYVAPVVVSEIESISDATSKLEVKADQVRITKDLQVDGQLIMAGWPPPGGDMSLPEEPTFKTVTTMGDTIVKGELRALGRGGRRLDQIYSCGGGPALSYSILESMRVCGREVARLDRCSSY